MPRSRRGSRPLFALAIATALGVGYVPFASGTFGSIVGLLVWALLPMELGAQAAAIMAILVLGCWSATVAERHFGLRDPSHVVIDEVLGMLVTLFLVPVRTGGVLVAFVLFRLADIVKPFPANRLERLPKGLGVMADDLMAAIYANLALRAILALSGRVI
jgi:phosphatidylglycerophosphatase A